MGSCKVNPDVKLINVIPNNHIYSLPAVHGGWTRWSEWSECSTSCNNGTQTRRRSCTNPEPMYGGDDCEGEWVENRNCFLTHCPVDCVWLPWTEWGQCTLDCGNGTQFRTREKLVERYGGRPCNGPSTESRRCNTHHCAGECPALRLRSISD